MKSNSQTLLRLLFTTSMLCVLLGANTHVASAGVRTAAPSKVTWETGHTYNCPEGVQVLHPDKTPSYIAAHPNALLASRPHVDANARRILRKVARSHVRWHSSLHCAKGHPGQPSPRRTKLADLNETITHNWSGYQSDIQSNYLTASMGWTVPAVTSPPDSGGTSSIWPGVGTGDSPEDSLVQLGTEQDSSCATTTCNATYYAWWEIYPQEIQQKFSDLEISPGDTISAVVEYLPGTSPSALFDIYNLTTDEAYEVEQQIEGDAAGSGSSVEWIAERTQFGSAYPPLADFGNLDIGHAFSEVGQNLDDPNLDGYFASDAALDSDDLWMWNCAENTLLANPTEFTSDIGDFSISWDAAGTTDLVTQCKS